MNGCRNVNCNNPHCASSSQFAHPGLTPNQAAVLAVELTLNRACLCSDISTEQSQGSMDQTSSQRDTEQELETEQSAESNLQNNELQLDTRNATNSSANRDLPNSATSTQVLEESFPRRLGLQEINQLLSFFCSSNRLSSTQTNAERNAQSGSHNHELTTESSSHLVPSSNNHGLVDSLTSTSTEESHPFRLGTPELSQLLMFLVDAPENTDINSSDFDDVNGSLGAGGRSGDRDFRVSFGFRDRPSLFDSTSSSTNADALENFRNTRNATSTNVIIERESRKHGLTLSELQDAVNTGQKDGNWSCLITLLNAVFSSYDALSNSFLSSHSTVALDIKCQNDIKMNEESDLIGLSSKAKKLKHENAHSNVPSLMEISKQSQRITEPSGDISAKSISDEELLTEQSCTVPMELDNSQSNETKMDLSKSEVDLDTQASWPFVNLQEVRLAWSIISSLPERQNVIDALVRAIRRLVVISLHQLLIIQPPDRLDDSNPPTDIKIIHQKLVNLFVILYECPFATDPLHFELLLLNINRAVTWLPISIQVKLCQAWANSVYLPLANCTKSPNPEQTNLWCLQKIILHHITLRCLTTDHGLPNEDKQICEAALVLRIVYFASLLAGKMDSPELLQLEQEENQEFDSQMRNHINYFPERRSRVSLPEDPLAKALNISPNDCRKPFIPSKDFINETLNDGLQPRKDYVYYRSKNSSNELSFMRLPFLLQTSFKSVLLYYDNRMRMLDERREVFTNALFSSTPEMPVFKLRVSRERIVEDTLLTLEITSMENPGEFKKQLLVEFEGEQGIDEGGLSKEFFQLIIERIFNPDYGMFVVDEETQTYWFNPTPIENMDREYCLIGNLIGLAIYNDIILDIHFPSVLYRKLVGKMGTFEDLLDARPGLASGLQSLLDYEGDDLQDTFCCTFVVNYLDTFGNVRTENLKPNGNSIPVTKENRKEYVDLYTDFILNKSVKKQFNAFRRGFQMVINESPLTFLFRPDEIEVLVRGEPHYNFKELERVTTYEEYTAKSNVIQNFWTLVYSMSEEQQKQLLQFCTGSDRIPVGGMSKMRFTIARQGSDTDRLPTAHTCFNILLLPEYETMDKLKQFLLLAITYCKGFGMS